MPRKRSVRNSGSLATRAVSLLHGSFVIGLASAVAFDEDLADRIRARAACSSGCEWRRPGRVAHGPFVTRAHVERFEMRGRPMNGWLRVDTPGLRTKSLPPKGRLR